MKKIYGAKQTILIICLFVGLLCFSLAIVKKNVEASWFKQGALQYNSNQPLHHFSQWTYWPTEDWAAHIKWELRYLVPPLQDGANVFEAGCGVGAYLQTLQGLIPNIKLSGVDIVPEAIQVANQVLVGNFYVADAKKLSKEKNNSYDYCVANCVIGYLNNLAEAKQMIAELVRITKNQRSLMVSALVESNNQSAGSLRLFIPRAWWHENAAAWNVEITSIQRMGDWPGAHSQGDRYAVFMKKL